MAAVASTSPTSDVNGPRELKLIPKHLATSLPQLNLSLSGPRRSHRCRENDYDVNETSRSGEYFIVMPKVSTAATDAAISTTPQFSYRGGRTFQGMFIGRPRKKKSSSDNSDGSSIGARQSFDFSRRGAKQ